MDCKRIKAKLIQNSYKISRIQKRYFVEGFKKCYEVEGGKKLQYNITEKRKQYGVCYCIRYRPIGLPEWILARGRWNDKGERTADGIFNDGLV